MRNTGKIIGGIALLALGVALLLEVSGIINIDFEGWWTAFIIIPCLIGFINDRNKTWPLIGICVGVLLLLATRGVISWNNLWEYILCIALIVGGIMLIIGHGGKCRCKTDKTNVDSLKEVDQEGLKIRQIETTFGKHNYEFAGQRFEGAKVRTEFGFVGLDLRGADILDGAVIDIDCSFGGMEIRVGDDILVRQAVDTAFAGVESKEHLINPSAAKTLVVKGRCSFGGIEIK